MSFFEKLKRDIGITDEKKEKVKSPKQSSRDATGQIKKEKVEKEKEKPNSLPTEALSGAKASVKASTSARTSADKSADKEKPEKILVSLPKKESTGWLKAEGQLAVDVYQTGSEFCVQAPIAGIELEDLEVSVENEMLLIKGVRKEPVKDSEKNYFYQECYWGPFSRQVILPDDVDVSRIRASLNKGILMVRIPRVKKIKKKKVTIQTTE